MEEKSVLQAQIYFMVEEELEVDWIFLQQEETEVAVQQVHGVQVEPLAQLIQEAAVEVLIPIPNVVVEKVVLVS
jgi:hypothetical protein